MLNRHSLSTLIVVLSSIMMTPYETKTISLIIPLSFFNKAIERILNQHPIRQHPYLTAGTMLAISGGIATCINNRSSVTSWIQSKMGTVGRWLKQTMKTTIPAPQPSPDIHNVPNNAHVPINLFNVHQKLSLPIAMHLLPHQPSGTIQQHQYPKQPLYGISQHERKEALQPLLNLNYQETLQFEKIISYPTRRIQWLSECITQTDELKAKHHIEFNYTKASEIIHNWNDPFIDTHIHATKILIALLIECNIYINAHNYSNKKFLTQDINSHVEVLNTILDRLIVQEQMDKMRKLRELDTAHINRLTQENTAIKEQLHRVKKSSNAAPPPYNTDTQTPLNISATPAIIQPTQNLPIGLEHHKERLISFIQEIKKSHYYNQEEREYLNRAPDIVASTKTIQECNTIRTKILDIAINQFNNDRLAKSQVSYFVICKALSDFFTNDNINYMDDDEIYRWYQKIKTQKKPLNDEREKFGPNKSPQKTCDIKIFFKKSFSYA